MRFNLNRELTPKERADIEAAHIKIRNAVEEIASLFPTEAHIFLTRSFQAISRNDHLALNQLTKTLKLDKALDVFPLVWQALVASKDKWAPMKRTISIDKPENMLGYVRSIAWRLKNKDRKLDIAGDALLLDIFPIEDNDGEPLDPIGNIEDETNTDIEELDLWLTIQQKIKSDKLIKPANAQAILDLIRARVFYDVTKKSAHGVLNWDQKKVEAVWKEIQRKGILKKIHFS
ncbi:MAG: hypothetical protein ABIN18_19200 [Pseudomonadota bacterium]